MSEARSGAGEPTEVDGPPAEAPPLLVAENLGLRGARGWVYHDVDLTVPPGGLAAVAGQGGSGRSMLLLTLAGRAKPSTGRVSVTGADSAQAIRHAIAVARLTGIAEPEPELRVADHVRELDALLGRRAGVGAAFRTARETVALTAPDERFVADLDAVQATLLCLALALATGPRAVVLDDADRDLTPADQQAVWATLAKITATGPAVIASCADHQPATEHGAVVVRLPPKGTP